MRQHSQFKPLDAQQIQMTAMQRFWLYCSGYLYFIVRICFGFRYSIGEFTKRHRSLSGTYGTSLIGHVASTAGIVVSVLVLAFPVISHAATIEQAKAVFYNYDKDIANIQKAIGMYKAIIEETKDPSVLYAAYTGLSMAYLTMGDFAHLDHTDALKDYEAGKHAAWKAIAINPKGSDACFWYAGNIGRMAQREFFLKAVLVLPTFLHYLDRAYELNPKSLFALEAYAELYYELPGAFGGSDEKSIHFIHEALKIDPRYTMPLTTLAKVYISEGHYTQARDILNRVLQFKDPSYRAGWVMYDKPLAHKLLDSIQDKK